MKITEPEREEAPAVTLKDVEEKYPELVIWTGYSGTLYAAPRDQGPWPLPGDTPAGLAEEIEAAKQRMGDRWPQPSRGDAGPAGGP